MIVADANVFLRYLVRPLTPQDQAMIQSAATLSRLVQAGQETFITTDAVVAEVVFIRSSRRHYALARSAAAALLRPLLQFPGCKLPRRRRGLSALGLWVAMPRLSFVDALVAVCAQELDLPLASFDAEIAKVPGVRPWHPPSATP